MAGLRDTAGVPLRDTAGGLLYDTAGETELSVTLDSGIIGVAGIDLQAASTVSLDISAALSVAGSDLTTLEARTVTLDVGAITVAGEDLASASLIIALDSGSLTATANNLSLVIQPALDAGAVVVAGANVTIIGVGLQLLDTGSIAAAANDLAPHTRIALAAGTIAVESSDLNPRVMIPTPHRTVNAIGDSRAAIAGVPRAASAHGEIRGVKAA